MGGVWQYKACCIRIAKSRGSVAHISQYTWWPGHMKRTTSPSTGLSRGHSGITSWLRRTPNYIGCTPQRHIGWWSSQSRVEGECQQAIPTSRFTSFTTMCNTRLWFCNRLLYPTPTALTVACAFPGWWSISATTTPPFALGGVERKHQSLEEEESQMGLIPHFGNTAKPLQQWSPFATWDGY